MDREATENRMIFHVDVNSAFLSWSAVRRLKEDPCALDLRTVPSAVGGDVATRHGIITARSIPAKKYGVQTGEPVTQALKKCPGLILVPSEFDTYREYSRRFMDILRSYSRLVEPASIDEAFVDMTEFVREMPGTGQGDPADPAVREAAVKAADLIRDNVRRALGFTVNVGISTNRLLAKMASDFKKPDLTHELWPDQIEQKMWPLPIGELFGCGPKTAARLESMGIKTIGDAAAMDPTILRVLLGENSGAYIHQAANGAGSTTVRVEREAAKSYSNETTTAEDITTDNYEAQAPAIIRKLSDKVSARLRKDSVKGLTVTVTVKTSDFRRHSRQTRLERATDDGDEIFRNSMKLLKVLMFGEGGEQGLYREQSGIRLLGVGVSSLTHGEEEESQLTLEDIARVSEPAEKADPKLDDLLESINKKFGSGTIRRGGR